MNDGDHLVKTYDRLMQLAINEDRNASERTNFFLLVNSFLVTGFVVALSQSVPQGIEYVLASIGIFFCVLHFFAINYTWKTHSFWFKLITDEMEKTKLPEEYRREKLVPYSRRKEYEQFEGKGFWKIMAKLKIGPVEISSYVFPLLFFAMWVTLTIISSL